MKESLQRFSRFILQYMARDEEVRQDATFSELNLHEREDYRMELQPLTTIKVQIGKKKSEVGAW